MKRALFILGGVALAVAAWGGIFGGDVNVRAGGGPNLIVNGGFDEDADGWEWENVEGGGWQPAGGNPGGYFILNQSGQCDTDPTLQQTVTGLQAGHSYTVTGDYASYAPGFGNPEKPDAFAVAIDGEAVGEFPRPSPVAEAWTGFSASFTAPGEEIVLSFIAERDCDDSSFSVDNISLLAGALQGDVDCNGSVNSVDALKLLRDIAGLSISQEEGCPDIGEPMPFPFGDVDCNETVNSVDALKVLRHIAGLSVAQEEGCSAIGFPI